MTTTPTSVRLPAGLVEGLKALARRRSLAEDRDISWADIAREGLQHVLAREAPPCER
jgi:hypothetical protein